MKQNQKTIAKAVSGISALALLAGCAGFEGAVGTAAERAALFSSNKIFSPRTAAGSLSGSGLGQPASGSLATDPMDPRFGSLTSGANLSELGAGGLSGGSPIVGSIPLKFHCSTNSMDARIVDAGNIRVRAESITAPGTSCRYVDTGLKNLMAQNRAIDLNRIHNNLKAACPSLPVGEYLLNFDSDLALLASNQAYTGRGSHEKEGIGSSRDQILATVHAQITADKLTVFTTALNGDGDDGEDGFEQGPNGIKRLHVLFDYNPENTQQAMPSVSCDSKGSPLVIQLPSNGRQVSEQLELTSQLSGVLFDIMGQNATPAPHTPLRISWLRSLDYHFVTLPNQNGQVLGVDQLFGDNTAGPDGQFAADGFAALAKWDGKAVDGRTRVGRADGLIDANDPIFAQLRLWQDRNFDGVAQSNELRRLADAGVKTIDLNFDPNYIEVDIYGNEVKFKSAVRMNDGSLKVIFDLWFSTRQP